MPILLKKGYNMATLIIASTIILGCVYFLNDIAEFAHLKRLKMYYCILAIFAIAVAGLMVKSVLVPNAENMATIYSAESHDRQILYKDTKSGQYFVLEENMWNPFEATYRNYVDTELAEEFISHYNKLYEFDFSK